MIDKKKKKDGPVLNVWHLLCIWLELQIRKPKVTQSEGFCCFSESWNCVISSARAAALSRETYAVSYYPGSGTERPYWMSAGEATEQWQG